MIFKSAGFIDLRFFYGDLGFRFALLALFATCAFCWSLCFIGLGGCSGSCALLGSAFASLYVFGLYFCFLGFVLLEDFF